ncbi:hypothetical protein [Tetragenococcus halophilus]|uniref:hypothetical protein n=1 Tax=Tetragenococcus halophilus TaxID=51669 RepID=UPI00300FFED2
MDKEEIKNMQLEFSHTPSDGSLEKSDLEFRSLEDDRTVLIKNAEMHLDIDFEKGGDDQTPEFRLIGEYWDEPENIIKAINEAEEEDIEEVE